MNIRPTQTSTFNLVRSGIRFNFSDMVRAQTQVATGRRILRPSDDATGTANLLGFRRQIADTNRFLETIGLVTPVLEAGTAALQDSGEILSEARELLIQGMSGALNDGDRLLIADQIDLLRDRLIELGNSRSGDRYLFAGTDTGTRPYGSDSVGGLNRVAYHGNSELHNVFVGLGTEISINVPGDQVFERFDPSGTQYVGLTGAQAGTSSDQGSGYEYLTLRNVGTSGTLGSGLALVGGLGDSILGDHSLLVDGTNGTVQLDSGALIQIPSAGDPDFANFTVTNELGAVVHLDFSTYTGGDVTSTVTGDGSASIDGVNFVSISFSETNLELIDSDSGAVVHIDTTAVHRAGTELVTFSGTGNAFDTLQGISDDLRNIHSLATSDVFDRLGQRLDDLEQDHNHVLSGLSRLGMRSERLRQSENRLQDLNLHLSGLASNVEDADITEAILDLTKAEQTMQLAQMTGARLIQNSLINFLR